MESCTCKNDNYACDFCGKSDQCAVHKEEAEYTERCYHCKAYFCNTCGDVFGSKECNECLDKSEESE